MTKKTRGVFGILLGLALVLGLVPGVVATAHADGGVAMVDNAEYNTLEAALNDWTDGTTLTLLENVTTAATIRVDSGTRTFDLGGHKITMTGTSGSVFCVTGGGSLTVNGPGTISGGKGMLGRHVGHDDDYIRGGGFYIAGEATVNNVDITDNQAEWGGGVCITGSGTFSMTGGTISNNTSTHHEGWTSGGGVWIQNNGTFIMDGGAVTKNTAEDQVGGVHAVDNGTFIVSGAAVISGNTHYDAERNVKGTITVDNEKGLTGAKIGVTMDSPGVFTNSTDTTRNDASKFFSDNESYAVGKYPANADSNAGQLFLGTPVKVTFDANGHGTAPGGQAVASGSVVDEPEDPTEAGYTFGGWFKDSECTDGNAWDFEKDTVSAATTLYAKWTAVPATAPTVEGAADLALTYGYSEGGVSVTATAADDAKYELSYQWYQNTEESSETGTPIEGATEPSYAIPTGKAVGTTEYYYCVVTAKRTDNGEKAKANSEVATVTVAKADSRVTKAPVATNPTYDGKAQALVTAGTAEGGEMQYSLDGKAFSEKVPTATDAGTYTVWYKVVGDANHNDSEPQKVTSTIAKKDEPAPAEVPPVSVTAHVQRKGTLAAVSGGAIAGTTGKSLRMESLRLTVPGASESGGIEYRGHVQRKGWEKTWAKDGAMAGTEGKSRRMEAVQIRLWGDMESKYDVYYRVHSQRYGWMAWAKNGQSAGTQGMSRRAEAIQVVLVAKDAPAPATDFQGATQAYAKAFAKK